MSIPRTAYAYRGEYARLHAPRCIPIIIVPGVMGTRLKTPDGKLAWNPLGYPFGEDGVDSSPGVWTVDYAALQSGALVPAHGDAYEDAATNKEVAHITEYASLMPDYYGKLARELADARIKHGETSVRTRVYCCGYDWSADLSRAAFYVQQMVERALRETGERRVILVAHSMGGLVCRFYMRVLGGEERVERLFLLASPTLGSLEMYTQLKTGITGWYGRDAIDGIVAGDHWGHALEWGRLAADIPDIVQKTADAGFGGFASGWLGDIYLLISLGAGKLLTRDESMRFFRSFTSAYQLLPHPILCEDYPWWLIFDPMATGHFPTGFMVVLPTLLKEGVIGLGIDSVALMTAEADALAEEWKGDVDRFFNPGRVAHTSPRATRNMITLGDFFEKIGSELVKLGPAEAIATSLPDPDDPCPPEAAAKPPEYDAFEVIGKVITLVTELIDYLGRTFVDCRNARMLYSDIYTGFLDIVELRPQAARNLALAYRFFDALTVNPREEEAISVTGLIGKLFAPLGSFWGPAFASLGPNGMPVGEAFKKLTEEYHQEKEAERLAKQRGRSRIYIPPRASNVWCDNLATVAPGPLLPTAIVSNDDSNVVYWDLLPDFVGMQQQIAEQIESITDSPRPPVAPGDAALANDRIRDLVMGDDRVSRASAYPDPERMSAPFVSELKLANAHHGEVPIHPQTIAFILDELALLLPDFLRNG